MSEIFSENRPPTDKPHILGIDIETFSSVELSKCGVFRYSESPDFEILLFAYAFDDDEVRIVDMVCGEMLPAKVLEALDNPEIIKAAWNAQFERTCIGRYLGRRLSPDSWRCSMVHAASLSLPLSLKEAAKVLKTGEQKDRAGENLIRYFSIPCKPTKSNGGRTRNLPQHDSEKWILFKEYNHRDVEVEIAIKQKLARFPVPDFVWDEYHLDQEINDRGIMIDPEFVSNAIAFDERSRASLMSKMRDITGIDNPNSVQQMKEWLSDRGVEMESLGKKEVAKFVKDSIGNMDGNITEALKLRLQLAKSSVRKYQAMQNVMCSDGRAHGMFQFYGANRSGRWAGRLIQLQNLPQNHIPDLAEARALVRSGDYDTMNLLYNDIPDTLSQLIRTAFIPKPGCKFIVSDYSAIEARVLAHIAGEKWRSKVFAEGKDIYCASASQMFGVPVEKHGINSHLRQKGKIAELALGYGGSVGALKSMGALDNGLQEEELQPLVNAWRQANPNIVHFWWDVDNAVKTTVRQRIKTEVRGIRFSYKSGMLFITLPSGRKLSYIKPRMTQNRFGRESLSYEGVGESKKWMRIETYGPKLVENIVQATARDLLALAMLRLRNKGFEIVMHIHDEAVLEVPEGVSSVEEICQIMSEQPDWAAGLPLRADGYECAFYKKD